MAEADIFNSAIPADQPEVVRGNVTAEDRVSELYEVHRAKMYRFLLSQGLDSGTAQELAQEVFVRLFVAISKGKKILSEQAWLYGVASKLAVDYWRREGRAMWVELDSLPLPADHLPSAGPTPEAALEQQERLRRVARVLIHLPKEQRLGIQLRMQGLRYRAIAEILGVSVSTVGELISRAVERLRSAADG